jgi:hypothetical protein
MRRFATEHHINNHTQQYEDYEFLHLKAQVKACHFDFWTQRQVTAEVAYSIESISNVFG